MKQNRSQDRTWSVGIDLGMTKSAIAYVVGGSGNAEPQAIPFENIYPKIASAVYFAPDGSQIIGDDALKIGGNDSNRLFTNFKLKLGFPPSYVGTQNGTPISANELAEQIIRKLLDNATGHQIITSQPVICHPVGDRWADTILKLGSDLQLDAVPLAEPIAALYWAQRQYGIFDDRNQIVLLIDFGGGTCDFLLLRVRGTIFRGHFLPQPELIDEDRLDFGGKNIDELVKAELIRRWRFQNPSKPELTADEDLRLYFKAREVKEVLSKRCSEGRARHRERIHLPMPGASVLDTEMTPDDLYSLTKDEIQQRFEWLLLNDDIVKSHQKLLGRTDINPKDITTVILAGGSSQLPWISNEVLRSIFPTLSRQKRILLLKQPDMSVAFGAALYAYDMNSSEPRVPRVLQEDLKIEIEGGKAHRLAKHGSKLPLEVLDFFPFPKTGTELTINLVKGQGHRAAECRPLSFEPRNLSFEKPIDEGRMMRMKVQVYIDRDVRIQVSRAGPVKGETVEALFSWIDAKN